MVERNQQVGDAARRRGEFCHPWIVVDDPVEGVLHLDECRRRLHDLTERHGGGKILRCTENDRDDRCNDVVAVRDEHGAHILAGELAVSLDQGRQQLGEAGALFLFAAENGDALAVLAQPGQGIAKFGLRLVLALSRRHEAPGDEQHAGCDDDAVHHHGNDQVTGDVEFAAVPVHLEAAADEPEHTDEGRRSQERREDAGREVDRSFRCDPHILGEAVLGVLVLAGDQVELVISSIVEPAVTDVLGHPGAPAPLNAHARPDHHDCDGNAEDGKRNENPRLMDDRCAVLLLKRVEYLAIPDVDPVARDELQDDQHDECRGHQPSDATLIAGPESASRPRKASYQGPLFIPIGLVFGHGHP